MWRTKETGMPKDQGLTWIGMVVVTLLATSSVMLPAVARAEPGMRLAGFTREHACPDHTDHELPDRHGRLPWREPLP
ncbi:hypothetical protein [Streptomyces sp. WAC06614]|uniref:hypothetical protein n=1 Tax=Streptomyces sp. WAC06614 TaxID=2487416 RepID=UPI000F79F7B5|nr:hypothetical protein [Streptomyces sp. WAC06614]RSS66690.1 hypothetical protein EF918_29390 [Streptomyces sp. WAC06614]